MILQALCAYYDRLISDGTHGIAEMGFQRQGIPFLVNLDRRGNFVGLVDTRTGEGRSKVARTFFVPKGVKKTSGVKANVLWDSPAYVFGRYKPDSKKATKKLAERATKQHECFKNMIKKRLASALSDDGVASVAVFLERGDFSAVFADPSWPEIEEGGLNLSFKLKDDGCLVCERPAVVAALKTSGAGTEASQRCLITGRSESIARLHTAIKGVAGAQTSGSNIVSFNLPAFRSLGKKQSFNAPVGVAAEFSYTTALNHLLARDSTQKLRIGDVTAVFWAERNHRIEAVFSNLFGDSGKGEAEQDYKQLISVFRTPEVGTPPNLDPETRFFVLGLSPNASRLSIRFWFAGTVKEIADRIWDHFNDLEMIKGPKEWRSITFSRLLRSMALQERLENIPPNLAGDTMKSILGGTPYPQTLLASTVRRCRAEQSVTYPRAALIKAILVRDQRFNTRFTIKDEKELTMALDNANHNIGYRLGRLFATLEKIQEDVSSGINAANRDRFFSTASANPVVAFPKLMKLKVHHLSKMGNRGHVVNYEKTITEIIDGLSEFPNHLKLADQGRFAVGYYHQRQAFFTKRETAEKQGA